MSDETTLRKFVRHEFTKGVSRAQVFNNVWRRLGYRGIELNTIEQWFQFVQGHQKYSPNFDFNKKHYQVLNAILEEWQKNWSAIVEWTEPQIKAFRMIDSRYAMGVKTFKGKVISLVHFDNLLRTQREMKVDFDIHVDENREMILECVNENIIFIVIKFTYEKEDDDFFMYLLNLDLDQFKAALIDQYRYYQTYYCTIYNPKSRQHLAIISGNIAQAWIETGRVDDAGLGLDRAIKINHNSMGFRVDENLEYIHFAINKGFSFREVEVANEESKHEITTNYTIDADDGLFDWNILNAPYKWSGQNCYIAKQLKGGLDQFVICRFSEATKKLEKTGIQLVGKCVDLAVDDGNKLTICVKNGDQFVMHQFQLGFVF